MIGFNIWETLVSLKAIPGKRRNQGGGRTALWKRSCDPFPLFLHLFLFCLSDDQVEFKRTFQFLSGTAGNTQTNRVLVSAFPLFHFLPGHLQAPACWPASQSSSEAWIRRGENGGRGEKGGCLRGGSGPGANFRPALPAQTGEAPRPAPTGCRTPPGTPAGLPSSLQLAVGGTEAEEEQ